MRDKAKEIKSASSENLDQPDVHSFSPVCTEKPLSSRRQFGHLATK